MLGQQLGGAQCLQPGVAGFAVVGRDGTKHSRSYPRGAFGSWGVAYGDQVFDEQTRELVVQQRGRLYSDFLRPWGRSNCCHWMVDRGLIHARRGERSGMDVQTLALPMDC